MKKLMNVLAAAVLISGLAGCAEGGGLLGSAGGEVEVRVAAALDGGASVTKAYGEEGTPSTANRVILEVYMNDAGTPALYGERLYAKAEGDLAVFSGVRLLTGHEYLFVLWADRVADPDSEAGLKTDNHYDTGSLSALGYKTAGLPANDDDADAFYAKVKKRISKSETVDATLVRPFGQLNVYAKDYDGIPMGNLRPAKVSVSFDGVPSGLDLVNGTVLDPVPMVVDAVSVAESETGDASKGRRMGYNYIFTMAEDGQSHLLEKFSMSFLGEDGTTPVAESYDFPAGIPLQRNYRTNVTGNLLTGGVVVNVELQPVFGGENDENLQ